MLPLVFDILLAITAFHAIFTTRHQGHLPIRHSTRRTFITFGRARQEARYYLKEHSGRKCRDEIANTTLLHFRQARALALILSNMNTIYHFLFSCPALYSPLYRRLQMLSMRIDLLLLSRRNITFIAYIFIDTHFSDLRNWRAHASRVVLIIVLVSIVLYAYI